MSAITGPTGLNKTRSTEWLLSACLLVWGANMLRPEAYFDMPVYGIMSQIMTETRWGMITCTIAVLRMFGLAVNGWWRRTPVIRFLGALTGGLSWLAIGFLMLAGSYAVPGAKLPAGYGWYWVYFVFEGWCVLSTGYDMFKNASLSVGAKHRYVT